MNIMNMFVFKKMSHDMRKPTVWQRAIRILNSKVGQDAPLKKLLIVFFLDFDKY